MIPAFAVVPHIYVRCREARQPDGFPGAKKPPLRGASLDSLRPLGGLGAGFPTVVVLAGTKLVKLEM